MNTGSADTKVQRSFVIPVLDFSPHSSYNIRTLLGDLSNIHGEVICIFNSRNVYESLQNHSRINKYCYLSGNAGVSRSWNIGMNLAEGKSVFMLNADLCITPSAVSQLESYLFTLQNAVIVGPQGAHIDFHTFRDKRTFKKGTFNKSVPVHAVAGFFFAIHHERFIKHHLMFDVQFSPCFFEEWDIGLQVIQAGLSCYAVPIEGFNHHWGASQDRDLSVNYFGREITRSEIFSMGKERFKAKWHDALFNRKQ